MVQITLNPSRIAGRQNPYKPKEIGKAWQGLVTQTTELLKQYQDYKQSEKQLQIDNYKTQYKKQLQAFNTGFMDRVKSGEIKEQDVATAYKHYSDEYFNEYAKGIDLSLTTKERGQLQAGFAEINQQNFANTLSKQLVVNEKARSQAVLQQTVDNTNEMASSGLIGIEQVKATYDSSDFDKLGEMHYGEMWPEQKKIMQSTSVSGVYASLSNNLGKNHDVSELNKLFDHAKKETSLVKKDKESLLNKISAVRDNSIANRLADSYLVADENYDSQTVSKRIDENKTLTPNQKEMTKYTYLRKLANKRQQIEADYRQRRDEAWQTIFNTGNYMEVDAELFNSLDTATQTRMKTYKPVTKTDLTINNTLLYKVMHDDNVDVLEEGYKDLTLYDLQTLQQRQQLLNANPQEKSQAAKICQQVDDALARLNITQKGQKINLFGLIMDEIDGMQRTQKEPLTAGKVQEAINKLLPSVTKQN